MTPYPHFTILKRRRRRWRWVPFIKVTEYLCQTRYSKNSHIDICVEPKFDQAIYDVSRRSSLTHDPIIYPPTK